LIGKTENQIGTHNLSEEKPLVYTIKVTQNAENVPEKQSPRYRGLDKKPRKIDVNSLRNLKPFQSISDISKLHQYARDPYQKSALSSWLWIAIFIVFGTIIGLIVANRIWNYYKGKSEQSRMSDNFLKILEGDKNNG